jgi:hypothetical protein
MKTLYYNPMESPSKFRIVSKCFDINTEYTPMDSNGRPADYDELFALAKLDCFEQVEIYLTPHEEAYIKTSKKSLERVPVTGWVSLKGLANGGGYLNDPAFYFNR